MVHLNKPYCTVFSPFLRPGDGIYLLKFWICGTDVDQIKLYNILRNALKMTDEDAGELISAMATVSSKEFETKIQSLATKDDLKDLKMELFMALNKKIYLSGLVQFLALVASMLAIDFPQSIFIAFTPKLKIPILSVF